MQHTLSFLCMYVLPINTAILLLYRNRNKKKVSNLELYTQNYKYIYINTWNLTYLIGTHTEIPNIHTICSNTCATDCLSKVCWVSEKGLLQRKKLQKRLALATNPTKRTKLLRGPIGDRKSVHNAQVFAAVQPLILEKRKWLNLFAWNLKATQVHPFGIANLHSVPHTLQKQKYSNVNQTFSAPSSPTSLSYSDSSFMTIIRPPPLGSACGRLHRQ